MSIVCVISAGRPQNVAPMKDKIGYRRIVWFVPPEQEGEYALAGADEIQTAEGLCGARNAALEFCFEQGEACVQTDDDLKVIHALPKTDPKRELSFDDVVLEMEKALDETGLMLAGCSPTNNLFFAKEGTSTHKFIIASLMLARPEPFVRFDPEFRTKEDYDYTLQHWDVYGGAARCDWIAPNYAHYTNAGGAVDIRTDEVEQASIARLLEKWPGLVRLNPKRENEVLLKTLRGSAA